MASNSVSVTYSAGTVCKAVAPLDAPSRIVSKSSITSCFVSKPSVNSSLVAILGLSAAYIGSVSV